MAEDITKKEVIDPELEAVRRSMGDRMDPTEPVVETPVVETKKEEVTPVVTETKVDDEDEEIAEDKEPILQKDDEKKRVERPETHIPMPKYLAEKNDWKKTKAEKEALEVRVKELEAIDRSTAGASQDDQLTAFSEKHGMDIDAVKDLLGIVQKNLLPEEKLSQIDKADQIVKEKEREDQIKKSQDAFKKEFETAGVPELKKRYPDATAEQLALAQTFLDKAAHTEQFAKSELGYVIYKTDADLAKIFAPADEEAEVTPPVSRKTMERGRSGGKVGALSANDFKGKTDFTDLLALDPQAQESLRKEFDTTTYEAYLKFAIAKDKESGVEVMRNGRKINLK